MSHPTAALDDVVDQRSRLGVLAILSGGDRVEFTYVQEVLDLTAENLSRHLTMLVQAGLVTVEKGYSGRRPRTWVTVTKRGRQAYRDEMQVLRSLVNLVDAAELEAGQIDQPGDRLERARPAPGVPAE